MEEGRKKKEFPILLILKKAFSIKGEIGISMRIKLFLTLSTLVITILLGAFFILLITGTLTAGIRETQNGIKEQLNHISSQIETQYGQLSIQAVELSKSISTDIEKNLAVKGLTTNELQQHPEVLEGIISGEYDRCMFALQRSKSSGVFIILNATVNPYLSYSENSRAGLYIKTNEPNVISSSTPNNFILRGFSSIGRCNSISLHSQWRMEFDVANAPYFSLPIKEAENKGLSLSRLYYWNPLTVLPDTSDKVMLCSIPLIDSSGNVFGVCGFEISSMLFKLSYMPDNSGHGRIFCSLAPYTGDIINTNKALFSGRYMVRKITEADQKLTINKGKYFYSYSQEEGMQFVGFHNPVKIYPEGSAFEKEMWIAVLMVPKEDVVTSIMKLNSKVMLLFVLLLILAILGSYFLSKRYIMPFAKIIDIIKSNNYAEASKTNIYEIDDLMEFLSSNQERNKLDIDNMDKTSEKNKGEKSKNNKNTNKMLPTSLFDEFEKNTKTLSQAERAVFNLYIEGYTAKEITGILGLSINTIKTHNKRIYMKLNVTSREELLLYVNMLKEAGRELK